SSRRWRRCSARSPTTRRRTRASAASAATRRNRTSAPLGLDVLGHLPRPFLEDLAPPRRDLVPALGHVGLADLRREVGEPHVEALALRGRAGPAVGTASVGGNPLRLRRFVLGLPRTLSPAPHHLVLEDRRVGLPRRAAA